MIIWKENNLLLREDIENDNEEFDFSKLRNELESFDRKECIKYLNISNGKSTVLHYGDENILKGFSTLVGGTAVNRLFCCNEGENTGLLGEEWYNSPTYDEVLSLCKQFVSEYYKVCKNSVLSVFGMDTHDALYRIGDEYGFSIDDIYEKSNDNISFEELFSRYVADYDTLFDYGFYDLDNNVYDEGDYPPFPTDSTFEIEKIRNYFKNTVLYVRYDNVYYNIDDLVNFITKYKNAFGNLTDGIVF